MGATLEDNFSFPSTYSFAYAQDPKLSKQVHDNVHGNIYLDEVKCIVRSLSLSLCACGCVFIGIIFLLRKTLKLVSRKWIDSFKRSIVKAVVYFYLKS